MEIGPLEKRFGTIAVEKGFITMDQLVEAIDGQVMDAAGPQLKVISNCAVGVDNIDLAAATARGIPVGNTAYGTCGFSRLSNS